ncbi:hypothetical protein [Roseibaca sp. Y0-43]|uniref:hypothetical protein n=1 Tax=Roseibaca sp. Y0-43 TaxID=2816854 RepID=UPI001D0CD7A1|nr:hypothetical protein [Roseibaca sp. Y0-43]MCC1481031.1 hypothetical protein [Roseibaca sp. Y0-43]
MDTGFLFLLGVYLVPLAFVSAVSAWADGRRPTVAVGLAAFGVALAVIASVLRPDGVYGLSDIPVLTIELFTRIWRAF